jgi:hypothetical protein
MLFATGGGLIKLLAKMGIAHREPIADSDL